MRVLIADDEPVARQILRELLDDIGGITLAGEASTGAEAIEQIARIRPDVVLLDVQMPGLTGLEVSRSLPGARPPAVIFVTAYSDHALAAFDSGAVDYLMKPVRRERLEAALAKARAHGASPPSEVRRIIGRLGQDLHLLDPSEVIAFQAEGDLVYIITAKGRFYTSHTLRVLEDKLPPERFRRVHRSTIINTDQIRKISPLTSKRWLLRMSNGLEVIVSKRLSGVIREETEW